KKRNVNDPPSTSFNLHSPLLQQVSCCPDVILLAPRRSTIPHEGSCFFPDRPTVFIKTFNSVQRMRPGKLIRIAKGFQQGASARLLFAHPVESFTGDNGNRN